MNQVEQAIKVFDELNSKDPNKITLDSGEIAVELYMAQCMSLWVNKLVDDPSDSLLLAARCQHICRWQKPRSEYPEGRVAYLQWRKDLHSFHAEIARNVLNDLAFDDSLIQEVDALLHKKDRVSNPNTQVIEDALCLCFLENQFSDFVKKHEEEKLIRIVQKTWNKMSDKGHELALSIQFKEDEKELLEKALS